MNISAISFGAMCTENLQNLSKKVYDMKPYRSSDYTDLATNSDREVMDSFISALQTSKPSKETFNMGIHALKKSEAVQELPKLQHAISDLVLSIARKSPDVTKSDVLDNFTTLSKAQNSFSHYA